MVELDKLKRLWADFGNTPINDDDTIEEPFLHFELGTDRFEIWYWFEEQNPEFSVVKQTNGETI